VVVVARRGVGAYRWELAMVGVTAVWGSTFVLVRDAVEQIPPFTFVAYRFLAAALLLAALRPRLAAGGQPGLVGAGAVAGLALFAGYGFQTVGLQCGRLRRPHPAARPLRPPLLQLPAGRRPAGQRRAARPGLGRSGR
jgi:drug/metabolite transporter (DMT)-like permease